MSDMLLADANATAVGSRTDPVTGELADPVEGMIGRALNGRQVATELIDHHGYLATYDSIRHYIRYHDPDNASTNRMVDIQMRGAPAAGR
ncbi:hypothetical protein [Streptomyces sp. NPDC046939]|uniref:hypothetical protein n=1 Tax=Streptomyces sp. NPDC046939 TaxID=3155376 RepID=UPI0033C401E9